MFKNGEIMKTRSKFKAFSVSSLIRLFLLCKGFRIKIASTHKDVERANYLRESLNESFENPQEIQMFHENYGASSTIFIAEYAKEVVGTLRLINQEKCQFFDFYSVQLPATITQKDVLEVAGVTINKEFRKKGNLPLIGLFCAAFSYSFHRDVTNWVGFTKPWFLKSFKGFSNGVLEIEQEIPTTKNLQNRELYPHYFAGMGKQNICLIFDLKQTSFREYARMSLNFIKKKKK